MVDKRQEFLTAIYNSSFEYFNHAVNEQKAFIDEIMSKHKKEQTWAKIVAYSPWGLLYHYYKSLWNTGVSLVQGITNFTINLAQNSKNAWGSLKEGFETQDFSQFGKDILNVVGNAFDDAFRGIVQSGTTFVGNIGVLFGAEGGWTDPFEKAVANKAISPLEWGSYAKAKKGDVSSGLAFSEKETPEVLQMEDWSKNAIIEVNDFFSKGKIKGDWFERTLWDNEVYQIYSGIIDGVAGMLPVLAMSYTGIPFSSVMASAYFAATTYGNSVEEALNRGASVEDALSYGTGMVARTLLVQKIFGTLKIGSGKISPKLGTHLLKQSLKYAGRSVITSLMNSPIQYDEEGNRIYEDRKELLTRVGFQAIIGSGTGFILGLLEYGIHWGKVKERYGVKPKHGQAFLDMEDLLRQEWSKMTPEEQQEFQKTFKKGLDDVLNNLNEAQKEGGVLNDEMANMLMSKLNKTILGMMIERTEGGEFVLNFRGEQLYENLSPTTDSGKPLSENGVYRLSLGARVLEQYLDKDEQVVKINVLENSSTKYQEHRVQVDKVLNFAKLLGVDIVFFETVKDGAGLISPEQTTSTKSFFFGGISYINIDAVSNDIIGMSVNALSGHEIFHDVQRMVIEGKMSTSDRKIMTELMTQTLYMIADNTDNKNIVVQFFKDVDDGTTMQLISLEEAKATNAWSQVNITKAGGKTISISADNLVSNTGIGEIFAYFIQGFFNMDNIIDSLIAQKPELAKITLTFLEARKAAAFQAKYETTGLTAEEFKEYKQLIDLIEARSSAEQKYYNLLQSLQTSHQNNIWGHIFRMQQVIMPMQFSRDFFTDKFFTILDEGERKGVSLSNAYLVQHDNGKTLKPLAYNGEIIDHSVYYKSNEVSQFRSDLKNGNFENIEKWLLNTDKIKLSAATPNVKPFIGFAVSEVFAYEFASWAMDKKMKPVDQTHLSPEYINFLEENAVKSTLNNLDKYLTTRIEQKVREIKNTPPKIYNKISDGIYEVDANTYFDFFVLNYLMMRKANYVSLYPRSEYNNIKGKFFLREDGRGGFWVTGDKPTSETFSPRELGGIFNSNPDKRGFLKTIKPIALKEKAEVMYTISANTALKFYKVFGKDLRIARNKYDNAKLYGEYNNYFLTADWGAALNNVYTIMLRQEGDLPTYTAISSAGVDYVETALDNIKYEWINGFTEDNFSDGVKPLLIKEFVHIDSRLKNPFGIPYVFFLTNELFITNNNNQYYKYTQGRLAQGKFLKDLTPVFMNMTKLVGNNTKISVKKLALYISKIDDIKTKSALNRVLMGNKKFDKKGNIYIKNILFDMFDALKTHEQALVFFKMMGDVTGAEGYIIDNNKDFSVIPFDVGKLRPYSDVNNAIAKDVFKEYLEDTMSEEEKVSRANFEPSNIKGFKNFAKEASFIPLKITTKSSDADKEMFDKGYVLKHTLFNYYYHKNHFLVPKKFFVSSVNFRHQTGFQDVSIRVRNNITSTFVELPIFPDFLDTNTNKIIVNSQVVAFGTSLKGFSSVIKSGKSIEQSVSVESAINENFACEKFTGKDGEPKIIFILNATGAGKARFLTDIDLFTPERFIGKDYIMFVDIIDKELTKSLYQKALQEIADNNGVISKEISDKYRIYRIDDKNLPEYSRLETQKNIKRHVISTIKGYSGLSDTPTTETNKIRILSTIKGYFLSKMKGQEYLIEALSNNEFLRNLDKQYEKLLAIFYSYEVNEDAEQLLRVLGKAKYRDLMSFIYKIPFSGQTIVREGKADVDLKTDVAALFFEGLDETDSKTQKMLEVVKKKYPHIELQINAGGSMVAFNELKTHKPTMLYQGKDVKQVILEQEQIDNTIQNPEHTFLMEEVNGISEPLAETSHLVAKTAEQQGGVPPQSGGKEDKSKQLFDYWKDLKSRTKTIHDIEAYRKQEKLYANIIDEIKVDKSEPVTGFINNLKKIVDANIASKFKGDMLYNHIFAATMKHLIYNLVILSELGTEKLTQDLKETLIMGINETITNTMAYIDDKFSDSEINKLDPNNPQGFLYTKGIYYGFRDVGTKPPFDYEKDGRLKAYKNFIDAIEDLNYKNEEDYATLFNAITDFKDATDVDRVITIALSNRGKSARTLPNVIIQYRENINISLEMIGQKIGDGGKMSREGGIIPKMSYIDNLGRYRTFLNPFNFGDVASMFLPNGIAKVIAGEFTKAGVKQMEIEEHYLRFFEDGKWINNNRKNIIDLENNFVDIKNLLTEKNTYANLSLSQIVNFYALLKRELIMKALIQNGFFDGEDRKHFENGNVVRIAVKGKNKKLREENGFNVKIVDNVELFKELQTTIDNNPFAKELYDKVSDYFAEVFPYLNTTFKDIHGVEMNNESEIVQRFINTADEVEVQNFKNMFPENVDFTRIYMPNKVIGQSYTASGNFDARTILGSGIFDGITQELTSSSKILLIDSIGHLIPEYMREVKNLYGLNRLVKDLNSVFNSTVVLQKDNIQQTITLEQRLKEVNSNIIDYWSYLLKNMAGYRTPKDKMAQDAENFVRFFRRSLYISALGLNMQTMFTQISSMWNMGALFGSGKNPFTNIGFMTKYMKNMFLGVDNKKAKYLVENSVVYQNRARTGSFSIGEATDQSIMAHPLLKFFHKSTAHIRAMDSLNNRAMFMTLVESGYSEEKALKLVELGILQHQSSHQAIGRVELLRTSNEIVKLFLKFIGEPMQVLSNMATAFMRVNTIRKFEMHKDAIIEMIERRKAEYQKDLDARAEQVKKDADFKTSEAYTKFNDQEKKDFDAEAKKRAKNYWQRANEQGEFNRAHEDFRQGFEETVNNKKGAAEQLGRVISGWFGALLWLAFVGTSFSLLRGQWREKDDDEDMMVFLLKLYGKNFVDRFFSYAPFVRDVYGLVANSFSFTSIAEFETAENLMKEIKYIVQGISTGNQTNYLKTFRRLATYLGHALGIPVRNLERLFTTPLNLFSNKGTFIYKDATGQKINYQKEINLALKNNNVGHLEAIVQSKLNERNITLGSDVFNEVVRLSKESGEIISIVGNYGRFTIKGETYEMSDKEKDAFTAIYNQADDMASRVIRSSEYKQLNDKYKAKLLQSIFNYYYRMAKQKITGHQFIAEKSYFENSADAYDYFISVIANLLYKRQEKEYESKFS